MLSPGSISHIQEASQVAAKLGALSGSEGFLKLQANAGAVSQIFSGINGIMKATTPLAIANPLLSIATSAMTIFSSRKSENEEVMLDLIDSIDDLYDVVREMAVFYGIKINDVNQSLQGVRSDLATNYNTMLKCFLLNFQGMKEISRGIETVGANVKAVGEEVKAVSHQVSRVSLQLADVSTQLDASRREILTKLYETVHLVYQGFKHMETLLDRHLQLTRRAVTDAVEHIDMKLDGLSDRMDEGFSIIREHEFKKIFNSAYRWTCWAENKDEKKIEKQLDTKLFHTHLKLADALKYDEEGKIHPLSLSSAHHESKSSKPVLHETSWQTIFSSMDQLARYINQDLGIDLKMLKLKHPIVKPKLREIKSTSEDKKNKIASVFLEAVREGRKDDVKKILNSDDFRYISIDCTHEKYCHLTALGLAIAGGRIEIAKILIENGANTYIAEKKICSDYDLTSLGEIIKYGSLKTLESLLEGSLYQLYSQVNLDVEYKGISVLQSILSTAQNNADTLRGEPFPEELSDLSFIPMQKGAEEYLKNCRDLIKTLIDLGANRTINGGWANQSCYPQFIEKKELLNLISTYQPTDRFFTKVNMSGLFNPLIWVEGVMRYRKFMVTYANYASYFDEDQSHLDAIIKSGENFICFIQSLQITPQLFEKLFTRYEEAKTAPEKINQAHILIALAKLAGFKQPEIEQLESLTKIPTDTAGQKQLQATVRQSIVNKVNLYYFDDENKVISLVKNELNLLKLMKITLNEQLKESKKEQQPYARVTQSASGFFDLKQMKKEEPEFVAPRLA